MKKGFTLIELLAVIVILAIIALIATPIVLNIIEDTKESAVLRSAEFYMEGVEHSIATAILKNQTVNDGTYSIMEDGNICIGKLEDSLCKKDESIQGSGYVLEVNVKGEKPKEGTITISSGQVLDTQLIISNKEICKNPTTGKIEIKQEETNTPEVALAPGLYDKNDKLLMSWDELNAHAKKETATDYNADFDTIISGGTPGSTANKIIPAEAYKLVISNSVITIGSMAFSGCRGLKEIIIPNSVTSIGSQAFSGCTSLTSITIPESVTGIADSTFSGCTSLTSITIPNSVTSIGANAFFECTSLTSITIPESVTSIGDGAFGFSGLTNIKILNSNTSIGEFAFDSCGNLEVYYNGDWSNAPWGAESAK